MTRFETIQTGIVNLMLNTSDYDEAAINALVPLLKKTEMHVPGLRLTVYNSDGEYKLSSEIKKTLSENKNFKIFTPAVSGNVRFLTSEIRRQHVILTANNMMAHAASAARIKTVILPDAIISHTGRINFGRDSLKYITLTRSDKNHVFFRRLQSELFNALEEAVYANI